MGGRLSIFEAGSGRSVSARGVSIPAASGRSPCDRRAATPSSRPHESLRVARVNGGGPATQVSLRVAKTYVIYADVYQACTLLFWRDKDRQLYPLAKDADAHEAKGHRPRLEVVLVRIARTSWSTPAEVAGAHALGVVVGDGDRVRLLQYAPLVPIPIGEVNVC